jgi:hypothetical protein
LSGGFAEFKQLMPGLRRRRRSDAIAHGAATQPQIDRAGTVTAWTRGRAAISAKSEADED